MRVFHQKNESCLLSNIAIDGLTLCVYKTAFFLTESHVWLMERGRGDEAKKVLTKVRGNEKAVHSELESILNNIEERKRLTQSLPKQSKLKTFTDNFTTGGTIFLFAF